MTKRLNATIGIILGELIRKSNVRDPLRATRESWRPLQKENPSSFEQIAMISLSITPLVQEPSYGTLTPELKTLMAFIISKRKLYDSAKYILKDLLPILESQYGQGSMPFGLAVSEFVKCCNMTEELADGLHWARRALSKKLDISDVKTSPDTLYLRVALADSLLAASEYESAIELLDDILQKTQSDQPSIVIMLTVRLWKAHRRLGKPFPLPKLVNALPRGMQALGHVSAMLRRTYIEEIGCNIDSMDLSEAQRKDVHERIADLVSKSSCLPNKQGMTGHGEGFKEVLALTSPDRTSCENTSSHFLTLLMTCQPRRQSLFINPNRRQSLIKRNRGFKSHNYILFQANSIKV